MKARLLGLLLLAAGPAWGLSDPREMLPDPVQEARAERIGSQLRCLVCQNESIEDSGAGLARDLREAVREQVAAGHDDREVMAWMVARYGNFVRLSPPFDARTALLWATPVLSLLIGAGLMLGLRRRDRTGPAPLTPEEQARLRRLTGADATLP